MKYMHDYEYDELKILFIGDPSMTVDPPRLIIESPKMLCSMHYTSSRVLSGASLASMK